MTVLKKDSWTVGEAEGEVDMEVVLLRLVVVVAEEDASDASAWTSEDLPLKLLAVLLVPAPLGCAFGPTGEGFEGFSWAMADSDDK